MNKSDTLNNSRTDWERLNAMTNEDIDFSDIPEITPEMFATATVHHGKKADAVATEQITIAIESDVMAWYKAQGDDYERYVAAALRIYAEAHQHPNSEVA